MKSGVFNIVIFILSDYLYSLIYRLKLTIFFLVQVICYLVKVLSYSEIIKPPFNIISKDAI